MIGPIKTTTKERNKMRIQEAVQKRVELEKAIMGLLVGFRDETGLTVSEISLDVADTAQFGCRSGCKQFVGVTARIDL